MLKTKTRLLSFVLSLVLVFTCAFAGMSASASEPNLPSQEITENDATTRSLGNIIASGATTIYGGSGSLAVVLPSGNFWADLVAGIGYTDQAGIVNVTVTTPDGQTHSLGSIVGTGSSTVPYELAWAPAGTYYFNFYSAISTPIEVYARIHD